MNGDDQEQCTQISMKKLRREKKIAYKLITLLQMTNSIWEIDKLKISKKKMSN